jgi:hypothetical protein
MRLDVLTLAALKQTQVSLGERQFHICGRLDVGDESRIEVEVEGTSIQLPVEDPSVRSRLLDTVPCRLGGSYLYSDSVELTGTLNVIGGRVVINQVVSGTVIRDGISHPF